MNVTRQEKRMQMNASKSACCVRPGRYTSREDEGRKDREDREDSRRRDMN